MKTVKIFLFGLFLVCTSANSILANDVVVVVLDDSGSMKEMMRTDKGQMSRLDAAKMALESVIELLPQETQLGVLLLNGGKATEHWIVPLGKLEKKSAKAKIQNLRPNNGTPLGAAMRTGMEELLKVRAKQVYGHFRLLVVTDGEATDADLLSKIFPDLISRGVSIDVIGVDMKGDHSLSTRAHSYRRASDGSSFKKAVEEVFAETASDEGAGNFELLSQLSDETAREALVALTTLNNAAIGEQVAPANADSIASPPKGNFGKSQPTNSKSTSFGGTICCFGVIVVIFLIGIGSAKPRGDELGLFKEDWMISRKGLVADTW